MTSCRARDLAALSHGDWGLPTRTLIHTTLSKPPNFSESHPIPDARILNTFAAPVTLSNTIQPRASGQDPGWAPHCPHASWIGRQAPTRSTEGRKTKVPGDLGPETRGLGATMASTASSIHLVASLDGFNDLTLPRVRMRKCCVWTVSPRRPSRPLWTTVARTTIRTRLQLLQLNAMFTELSS